MNISGQDVIGLLNVAVLGCGFSIPFILASRKHAADNAEKINKRFENKINELSISLTKITAELMPAYRNGGVATKEDLKSSMEMLDESLSVKIGFIQKRLDIHDDSSNTRGGISEERLVNIIRRELKK